MVKRPRSFARDIELLLVLVSSLSFQSVVAADPLFTDAFNRSGPLGAQWKVPSGTFAANGNAAVGSRPSSYAFWVGIPPNDFTSSVVIGPGIGNTYLGLTARGTLGAPDRAHYAAYVGPDGVIALSRRNNWTYLRLAVGPRFPAGTHTLSLALSGTSPVMLSVGLDGREVIRYRDESTAALKSGLSGIFDYNGHSSPIDAFSIDVEANTPPSFDETVARAVLGTAGDKLRRTVTVTPTTQYPKSTRSDGTWTNVPNTDMVGWTQGFFPASLWYLYQMTGDAAYRDPADVWTRNLEIQKTNRQTHDLGPKLFYSFGNAYRLTGDSYYLDVLQVGAESLASRYRPVAGVISCCDWNPRWRLPLVIDTMISLEMLMWAAENGGRPELRDMAISHALVTARELIRPDGSTYHVADFDPNTGAVRFKETFQGYANESTWSRGQAWAIYGFTLMYRYTHDARMLDAARRVTNYYLDHLPADNVPNWDFDAPRQSKDSSAASITASALLELATLEPDASNAERYRAAAIDMLASLCSPAYLAAPAATLGLLLHGVGHLPANQEIDVSLIYGDYFMVEALVRFLNGVAVTPRVTLVSPNGGDLLVGGQTRLIHWQTMGVVTQVRLELSLDNGVTWQDIVASTANEGQFLWTVPSINTSSARVRISDVRDPSTNDVSDKVFFIAIPAQALFSDDFNRTGALGTGWQVRSGAFVLNGSEAAANAPLSYAFWTGAPPVDVTVSITLGTPLRSTYVGVTGRGTSTVADRDHYAAYVAPDGRIYLGRRNNYIYTALSQGPAFPPGRHRLSMTTTGAGPVTIRVYLDDAEVLRFVDSSGSALRASGRAGIFDYNGAGQPLDHFEVAEP